MNDRVIVALDVERMEQAVALLDRLPQGRIFKVGLQAFLAFGEDLLAELDRRNKDVFLDLKFKDIPNTVAGAVRSALRFHPRMMTLHLSGGVEMVRQALEAAQGEENLLLLGVTVLTSLGDQDLHGMGSGLNCRDRVLRLVEMGLNAGMKGFVCSPQEVEPLRARFGKDPVLVTPGIRPAGAALGDQKRVFTPARAVEVGCSYMVVGRPIVAAEDPGLAFDAVVREIDVALARS